MYLEDTVNKAIFLGSFCAYVLEAHPDAEVLVRGGKDSIKIDVSWGTSSGRVTSSQATPLLWIEDFKDPIEAATHYAQLACATVDAHQFDG